MKAFNEGEPAGATAYLSTGAMPAALPNISLKASITLFIVSPQKCVAKMCNVAEIDALEFDYALLLMTR